MNGTVLFLTGHLAFANLQRELDLIKPAFDYRVHNIGVKVAALMTNNIVSKRLDDVVGVDKVILPGLFNGDLDELSNKFGVPFEKGPKDLRDLGEFFGRSQRPRSLDQYSINIFAELVDAPKLSIDEIVALAKRNRDDGADVVDVGCLPGLDFPHLEETVATLKKEGFRVSVDSLNNDELVRAGKAGADYLLSLNDSNLWIADEVPSIPVLIPNDSQLSSLFEAVDAMMKKGLPFIVDPILDPFPFGFTASIERYAEVRRRFPDCEMLMGTGNLTELMDADTGGITAVLLSMMSELNINALLTTQVSTHACRAIREADLARRILFAAKEDQQLPRRYDAGLLGLHERKPFLYSSDEIENLAQSIRDRNYRIQVSESGIHLYNKHGAYLATDPFELMEHIDVGDDMSHMFYLGVELARAQVAWQLGKRYLQDNELEWGVARRDLPPVTHKTNSDTNDDVSKH